MDVRDDPTPGDGGLDESVELLVSPDRQLQVPRSDAFHLEVLAGVAGQFQDFGRQVFEDGGRVDGRGRPDAVTLVDRVLQEAVDTTDGELQARLGRARGRGLFGGRGLAALATLPTFSSFARLL